MIKVMVEARFLWIVDEDGDTLCSCHMLFLSSYIYKYKEKNSSRSIRAGG